MISPSSRDEDMTESLATDGGQVADEVGCGPTAPTDGMALAIQQR